VSYGFTTQFMIANLFVDVWLWFLVESKCVCTSVVQVCYSFCPKINPGFPRNGWTNAFLFLRNCIVSVASTKPH